jgi:L-iditol 2-dehydrogenase
MRPDFAGGAAGSASPNDRSDRPVTALRLVRPGEVRLSQEAMPEPRAGEVLIRVTAVGLCGSDMHWFSEGSIGDALLTQPLVLGHEFAGRIESGPRAGERVAVDPAVSCGHCDMCFAGAPNLCRSVIFAGHGSTDGALRTYLAWPERCLVTLPDNVTDAEGPLLEPLGVALHAADLGKLGPGQAAGVFGCGPIGLLLIQALRAQGAGPIFATERLAHRVEAARAAGATDAIQTTPDGRERQLILERTGGRGVDVAFETGGNDDAVGTAIATVRPGGRVVLVGIPSDERTSFNASSARRKGLTISMCRRMLPGDLVHAADLAAAGAVNLGPLISHRFPIADGAEAFATLAARRGLKVIVEP